MKVILCGILMSLLSLEAHAQQDRSKQRSNGLLRFIAQNQMLRGVGLLTMIGKRCSRYMAFPDSLLCQTTVARQLKILDYDMTMLGMNMLGEQKPNPQGIRPQTFVFVAFKKNLIDLLSSSRTTSYLNNLQELLHRQLIGKGHVNIWDVSLEHYRSPLAAAKVIAALFQDTSMTKLHIGYLDENRIRGQQSFMANKELLSKVIDTINLVLDHNEDNFRELFYPREVRRHLNRNIYHFYVPFYLAMALAQDGFNPIFSQAAPLMMTLTYEFVTAAPDYRYLINDPSRLDPEEFDHKLRDIYGGYSGSRLGSRLAVSPSFFPLLKETFARSTEDAVRLMLH